jgi:hypothetical protein
MKRGWLIIGLLILLISITGVSAKDYFSGSFFVGCHGITLCEEEFTCGVLDGICPDEYFFDTQYGCNYEFDLGFAHRIQKCLDPDCAACIAGVVNDSEGLPIEGATIRFIMNTWDGNDLVPLSIPTESNPDGSYILNAVEGYDIFLTAEAPGYSPGIIGPIDNLFTEDDNLCGQMNFTLQNGTCQADCTRMGSNYCSGTCHGESAINSDSEDQICLFNEDTEYNGIPITSPLEACSQWGSQLGSILKIGEEVNQFGVRMCVYTNCCEGNPYSLPCSNLQQDTPNIIVDDGPENMIKITKIARFRSEPVKLTIYYWQ